MARFTKLPGGTLINLDHVSRVDPPDQDGDVRIVGEAIDEYLKPGAATTALVAMLTGDNATREPGPPSLDGVQELRDALHAAVREIDAHNCEYKYVTSDVLLAKWRELLDRTAGPGAAEDRRREPGAVR